MPQSIEQFKGLMSEKGGIARTNLFLVQIPNPYPKGGSTSSELNLLCKDVSLPGRQIMTQERQIGLNTTKVAYGFAVEDVSMTFHVLNDMGTKAFFEVWQHMAIHRDKYEVRYKEKYARDVKISVLKKGFSLPIFNKPLGIPKLPSQLQNRLPKIGPFDLAQGQFQLDLGPPDKQIYTVTLRNAFCTTLNAIQLNNDPNGIMEINVQLSYDDWRGEFFKTSGIVDTLSSSVLGLISGAIRR